MRALRHPVGAVRKRGDPRGDLCGRVADLSNQLLEIVHHFVEDEGGLANFILAINRQAAGQIPFTTGDVTQTLAQFVEWGGNEVLGKQVDDYQQGTQRG